MIELKLMRKREAEAEERRLAKDGVMTAQPPVLLQKDLS